ncbi:MAG: MASE3 domain-containing protein [Desulfosoma sp.]|uniref:MASE3 domain-containing protein n=1 Tax=Desulfosoma sp. TaxID=2603217 RepID=UPI00404B5363
MICGIFVAAGVRLYTIREIFEPKVLGLLWAALAATVMAELAFTLYVNLYGLSNMMGHLFKFVSFWFIFEALVRTTIQEPFAVLSRQMKPNEQQLSEKKDTLETALKEIRTLRGLPPICSYCKRIRDDHGTWHDL